MKPPYKKYARTLIRNGEKLDKELGFFVLTLEKAGAKIIHAQNENETEQTVFHIMFQSSYKVALKIAKASRVFTIEMWDQNIWILSLPDKDDLAQASLEWEKTFGSIKDNDDNCGCVECRLGSKHVADHEEEMLKKHGWYAHFIADDDYPFGVNAHTHGFGYLFHPDIQICLNANPHLIHHTFETLYERIKNGEKFTPKKIYDDILDNNYKATFIQIDENLIRMIFPDKKNNLNPKTMHPAFAKQFLK